MKIGKEIKMNTLDLNHWFIEKNEMSISLVKFYVKITILHDNQNVYYQLYIKGDYDKELLFNFYTIEDAIRFTEQVVSKCDNTLEVINNYNLMFNNGEFENPYSKKKIKKY